MSESIATSGIKSYNKFVYRKGTFCMYLRIHEMSGSLITEKGEIVMAISTLHAVC